LTAGDVQTNERNTLSSIPLREGFDYTVWPPIDNTEGNEDTTKPMMAFIWDDALGLGWLKAEKVAGVTVHPPIRDWGAIVDTSPAQNLGFNHLVQDINGAGTTDPVATQFTNSSAKPFQDYPWRFDYETLLITLAIESDHRLTLTYNVPPIIIGTDGDGNPVYGQTDPTVMTVADETCECWVILPNTVVDINVASEGSVGSLALIPAPTSGTVQVLRNDAPRLAQSMAGAIANYTNDREKATLQYRGHYPMAWLLGTILSVQQQGDAIESLGAVVTSITWTMSRSPNGGNTMTVKTGYS
jgi:hypothetical protein